MRPALTWTIALGGLLLLAGAMAWATHSLMSMERTQHRMAGEAAVQERARLALWRMESLAAALVVGESARPPEQYHTTPDSAPLVSPAGPVLLHFEMDPDGRVNSPQVTGGSDKPPVPDGAALRLQELRGRLAEKATPDQWAMFGSGTVGGSSFSNARWLISYNADPPAEVLGNVALEDPVDAATANAGAEGSDSAESIQLSGPTDAPAPGVPSAPVENLVDRKQLSRAIKNDFQPPNVSLLPAVVQQEQQVNNKKESDMRQQVAMDGKKYAAPPRRAILEKGKPAAVEDATAGQEISNRGLAFEKDAEPTGIASDEDGGDDKKVALQLEAGIAPSSGNAPAAASRAAARGLAADLPSDSEGAAVKLAEASQPASAASTRLAGQEAPAKFSGDAPDPRQVRAASEPQPVNATISDFRALWIKDALLLTRRISQDGSAVIQGAWVDWPQLRATLLAAVSDLFPAAALEPAPAGNSGGSDLLASLPIRFLPGQLEIPAPAFWSPLKLSLATAWACVLLASCAVALVLRGMMLLSERRAAFVSAVTHELRTPLATFKLYSEMLADGLVKDPAKRQTYLETLSTEADRLGHLVENVLAYSRLERSTTSDGQLSITVSDLIHRVQPRLSQRTAAAGAIFTLQPEAIPDGFFLRTDPSAVEQILFNLVDNACKYAIRDAAPVHIELIISHVQKGLRFAVRDHGPGISRAEARRLFRPFHKSAREAAHSAPGVGLGLALCRRLARDLGGSLEIDHSWPHGACFLLSLPS